MKKLYLCLLTSLLSFISQSAISPSHNFIPPLSLLSSMALGFHEGPPQRLSEIGPLIVTVGAIGRLIDFHIPIGQATNSLSMSGMYQSYALSTTGYALGAVLRDMKNSLEDQKMINTTNDEKEKKEPLVSHDKKLSNIIIMTIIGSLLGRYSLNNN